MTKHKLDQVFKEKLEYYEVEPTVSAAEKFQSQLNGRKKYVAWYYLAASVSLLAGLSWWIWLSPTTTGPLATKGLQENPVEPTNDDLIAALVDTIRILNPVATVKETSPISPSEKIEEPVLVNSTDREVPIETEQPALANEQKAPLLAESTPSEAEIEIPETDSPLLESIEVAQTEISLAPEEVEEPLPVVTITYISGKKKKELLAGNEIPSDSADIKNGTLNAIINSAKSLANGSLIADLRDAKENLLNRNDD